MMDTKEVLLQWLINVSTSGRTVKMKIILIKNYTKHKPIYNKRIHFLLCVIDIFSKYAWLIPLKDKKAITITNSFQIILKESNRKPNKRMVYKRSEFKIRAINLWFKKILQ